MHLGVRAAGLGHWHLHRGGLMFGWLLNLGFAGSESGVPENLTEMFARKARQAAAIWGATYLEHPTSFIWQPETLMYRDVRTGHEVWRIRNGPLKNTGYQADIGVSPWSADGSKLAVTAYY